MSLKNPRVHYADGDWWFECQILITAEECIGKARKYLKLKNTPRRGVEFFKKYLADHLSGKLTGWDPYVHEGPFQSEAAARDFWKTVEAIPNGDDQHVFCLNWSRDQISEEERKEQDTLMKNWNGGGLPPLSAAAKRRLKVAIGEIETRLVSGLSSLADTGHRRQ